MRPLALAAAVFLLGNAMADHDWLLAVPLAAIVIAGIAVLACDATPAAPAVPDPARAAGDNARATGGEG